LIAEIKKVFRIKFKKWSCRRILNQLAAHRAKACQ